MKCILLAISATINLFGCSTNTVVEQAKLLGAENFSKDVWASANQEQRGKMIFSFLSQYNPETLTINIVKSHLGPPTGYYDYEVDPAYFVGPKSVKSEYGNGYLLAFISDKNTGKIISVKITPEPKKSN